MNDSRQEYICNLHGSHYLVLAGPGCGKTHILAQRVFIAHEAKNEAFADMLCLTFTNRAAREMQQRIENYLGYRPDGLFVGNLHRFCLHLLFENEIIHPDTSILDDDDFEAYTEGLYGKHTAAASLRFIQVARLFRQTELELPKELHERLSTPPSDTEWENARTYCRYKEQNRLLDFDDILILAYDALRWGRADTMNAYKWIQIDEVQDISPLQLAIVDMLEAPGATVMYLGDEQQAIFAFIGAGGPVLNKLAKRCDENVHHLMRNYRSPKQLVDLCNDLAACHLGIDRRLLPESVIGRANDIVNTLYQCAPSQMCAVAAENARNWLQRDAEGTVAVLARTNREARAVSQFFESIRLPHLLFSQKDVFRGVDFKTLWSHLAVCADPLRPAEWARLLYQTKACRNLSIAREVMGMLEKAAISGDELLTFNRSTMTERLFASGQSESSTIVVLDTETTGLDVFKDDIIQICAVKMRGGKPVAGSEFEVFIRTDREIPPTLGNLPNPMVEAYANAELLDADTAIGLFVEYISREQCIIAGHNLDFDLRILRSNIRRRTKLEVPDTLMPERPVLDTLKLSRLLLPHFKSYRLEYLIKQLKIDGVNSHNAADDVHATALLINELVKLSEAAVAHTNTLRMNKALVMTARKLADVYGELYFVTRNQMEVADENAANSLGNTMFNSYLYLLSHNCIRPIEHFHYILDLVNYVITGPGSQGTFHHQLQAHLRDLLTFNEGDLFSLGIIRERLNVMTVHKAKGLEMDHVIIYDAANGYGDFEEYLRVLYVAFSRARQTLQVGITRPFTRGLEALEKHFDCLPAGVVNALAMRGRRISPD